MNRYNDYMRNHFGSCLCLAHAYDPHRLRDVKIYLMPGISDAVGITDATDCWVAPISASLFTVNIERLLEQLHAGTAPNLPVIAKDAPWGQIKPRRRERTSTHTDASIQPETPPRRRFVTTDPALVIFTLRRRVV